MDVLTAGWLGSGSPSTSTLAAPWDGRCARCGTETTLTPTARAVSKSFTAFDRWCEVGGPGLCSVCAWGYATPRLRQLPHEVHREPTSLNQLTIAEAATHLAHGPIRAGVALVVPLRPGRKHLLPAAGWGRVTIDDAQLTWTHREATLLQHVLELRQSGFGSRMLREPAPSFAVLRRQPVHRWSAVLDLWERLSSWRSPNNPWLDLALHVTTTSEESP